MADQIDTRKGKKPISVLEKFRRTIRWVGGYIGVITIFITFILPFLWMTSSAFKNRDELFRYITPVSWKTFIPLRPTLLNFVELIFDQNFLLPMANSIGIAIISVSLALLINSSIAYVLARIEFRGREIIFILILSTMLIPFEAIMVPMFLTVQELGLDNTYWAIFLPWVADPFAIFLLRQHFKALPQDLEDAAIIDGCSYFQRFWRIMLPNIKPGLISVLIIKFIWSWDAYVWPLIVVREPKKMVVPIAIAQLFTDQDVLWGPVFAASFMATVPVVILFLFFQRYFIEGVVTSGIHG